MKPKIENIFLVGVFMVLLCIPVLRINRDASSVAENRMLAKMPHLITDGRINGGFGTEFNSWFSDRFFGRNTLIHAHNELINTLQTSDATVANNPAVLVGRENWLFLKGDNSLRNYTNADTLGDDEMAAGLQYLTDIDDWCRRHNKRFYFVIAPDKNKIYPEYYPSDIKKVRPDSFGMGMTFYKYIRNNSNINVMYPYDELIQAKDSGDLVYYNNDSHWNMLGSYIVFRILHRKIYGYDFDEKKFISHWTKEPYKGDLLQILDLRDSSRYMQELFNQPVFINDVKCTKSHGLRECKNPDGKLRAYMFRDSFYTALVPYMSRVFNVIGFYSRHDIRKSDLDSIADNYDVVILEAAERNIPKILKERFPKD